MREIEEQRAREKEGEREKNQQDQSVLFCMSYTNCRPNKYSTKPKSIQLKFVLRFAVMIFRFIFHSGLVSPRPKLIESKN